jgi:hypothetical protein
LGNTVRQDEIARLKSGVLPGLHHLKHLYMSISDAGARIKVGARSPDETPAYELYVEMTSFNYSEICHGGLL